MTLSLDKGRWLFRLGMLLGLPFLTAPSSHAQCDFVNDITGITLSTFPTGNAANPLLYTETYVLVDHNGNIYATGVSPDFLGVDAGLYNLYAVNYKNNEMAAVLPLLAVGQPWSAVQVYGDDAINCLDYTTPYGACNFSVCEEMNVCEFFSFTLTASTYTAANTQTYCLVCGGVVQAISAAGTFDLDAIPAAVPGANCQVFAVNHEPGAALPDLAVGGAWVGLETEACTGCADYIGMNLNILPLSQLSGNGISTPVDWSDALGCAGAQAGTNNGAPFAVTVNNWCTPDFSAPINARPDEVDDLIQYMAGNNPDIGSRVPCTGAMDLTQNPIFYTVECDPLQPSTLIVDVPLINTSGNITRIEAAMYGPVDPLCPVITGGTFVDCDDSGTGSLSGEGLSDLQLTTDALPGQVFLVIVDTEGREEFSIQSTVILLGQTVLNFSAHKDDDVNVAEWATTQEENTKHFVVERSNNGSTFEPLGTVNAAGSSQQEIKYSFIDQNPGEGTKYYRLKTVNMDESFAYSKIVALTRDIVSPTVNIYPNPTRNAFTVEFSTATEQDVNYEVLDIMGRQVFTGNTRTLNGLNKLEIQLGEAPSAAYIFSMTVDGYSINKRVIKS